MSVISIKRLLGEEVQSSAAHPLRVAKILMRGMGLYAIEGDPDAFRKFRDAIDQSAESLGKSVTEAAALVIVNATLRLLEEYNRGTESYLHSGGNDLRAMVKMLTAAITEFSSAGGENVQRLRHIATRVASAGQSNDVQSIKKQLAGCLDEIKKEVERQKVATSNVVSRLQEDLQRARTESVDPATGLPPRSKAVDSIMETCSSQQQAFAACLAIDRLQSVNLTFGSDIGDQILRYFASHVRGNLPPSDSLFRWTGASLLAVAPRAESLQHVRDEFAKLMAQKLEYTFQTSTRSVLLPITARWVVIPFSASPGTLIEQIDAFASPGAPA